MKIQRHTLTLALLAAVAAPAAHAEVAIDVIGGSEISFEGLVQADGNWFDNDVADLNGVGLNGDDSEFELRRAELVLKGKGPGNIEWVLGYDAKADKFLDANLKYKIGGNSQPLPAGRPVQAAQQHGRAVQHQEQRLHLQGRGHQYLRRRPPPRRRLRLRHHNWSLTASYFGRELTRNLAHGPGFGLRGTWAPINENGNMLHFGLAYVDYDTAPTIPSACAPAPMPTWPRCAWSTAAT